MMVLSKSGLFGTLLCGLFLTYTVSNAQPVTMQEFHDLQTYQQVLMDVSTTEDRLAVVREMYADANARLRQGKSGSDSILSRAGFWAKRLGDTDLMFKCWKLMLEEPESPAGEFSSHRMLGHAYLASGDTVQAQHHMRAALDIAKADNDLARKYIRSLVMVVQELAGLQEHQNKYQSAVDTRAILLKSNLIGVVDDIDRKWAMLENAGMYTRTGDTSKAIEWYGKYFSDSRLMKNDDPRSVMRARMQHAKLVYADDREGLAQELGTIWNDSEYANMPESAEVGLVLAEIMLPSGYGDGVSRYQLYKEIVDRLESILIQEGIVPEHAKIHISQLRNAKNVHDVALKYLEVALRYVVVDGAVGKHYSDALQGAVEYEKRFEITKDNAYIVDEKDRLMQRVAK